MLRIRADGQTRFVVATERCQRQGDIQQGKIIARRQQRMDIEPLDLRAVHHQIRDLNQQLTQTRDIQRIQPAAAADFAALDRLNDQIACQRHIQRRQGDGRLFVGLPLHATFAQHNNGAKQRILLHHYPQLLCARAAGHALHQ